MTPDPFDPIDDLDAATTERLRQAMRAGPHPLDAAAALARLGDAEGARALAMCVPFAEASQVASLAGSGDAVVSDALAVGVLGAALPSALREACALALESTAPTPAGLAALGEVSDGPKRPPWSHASRALAALTPRSSVAARAEADRLRAVAKQLRAGEGGGGRRLQYQREVARASTHAVLAALLDHEFLAGIVAPIADEVAPTLVPVALAAARAATDAQRAKALALIQRRWGVLAGLAVSCAVRTPGRPKEDALRVALVGVLGGMGAHEALASCAAVCAGAVRGAALQELSRAAERGALEADDALLDAALARVEGDADAALRAAAQRLRARR